MVILDPSHTLDLSRDLGLSPHQRALTAAAFEGMKVETAAFGEEVIAGEVELDTLFSSRKVDPESLNRVVMKIATAQGKLRAAHLRYHLQMTSILTPEQVANYARFRGYEPGAPAPGSRR